MVANLSPFPPHHRLIYQIELSFAFFIASWLRSSSKCSSFCRLSPSRLICGASLPFLSSAFRLQLFLLSRIISFLSPFQLIVVVSFPTQFWWLQFLRHSPLLFITLVDVQLNAFTCSLLPSFWSISRMYIVVSFSLPCSLSLSQHYLLLWLLASNTKCSALVNAFVCCTVVGWTLSHWLLSIPLYTKGWHIYFYYYVISCYSSSPTVCSFVLHDILYFIEN